MQEAMRDVSNNIACHFTRGRPKWFAFIKTYTTEMDAKPVFDCFLGAFLFGELLRFDLFTVRNRMIFYGNFATSNRNFQLEFARACCQVTEVMAFILRNWLGILFVFFFSFIYL